MEKRLPLMLTSLCGLGLLLGSPARAATYDEAVDGDLSTDENNPTLFNLDLGANAVSGSTTSDPLDRDFFTFTVGAGQSLDSIILTAYSNPDGFESFLAIDDQAGFDTLNNPNNYVGFALFNGDLLGTDLLEDVTDGSDPVLALGPGDYTLWYQETGGDTTYTFTLNLVPEPGSAAALLLGAGGLMTRRRR